MLETLLKILSWDIKAPEILLEVNGDICLDWRGASVSINPEGKVNWSDYSTKEHGTDLDELKQILRKP